MGLLGDETLRLAPNPFGGTASLGCLSGEAPHDFPSDAVL